MTRFTLGGGAEYGGHVVVTLNVGLGREVQVTPICLRLAGKRIFQILFSTAALKIHVVPPVKTCVGGKNFDLDVI